MITTIGNNWDNILEEEFKKDYFQNIIKKYDESCELVEGVGLHVFPKKEEVFNAFKLTAFNKIKVCIVGQDPYPGLCRKTKIPYANGLAFSVNKGCSIPASLKNIFKELKNDLNIENGEHGDLTQWAKQGIFLLNTQLSVVQGNANSHSFWKPFTDFVIKYISDNSENVIFVCWGRNALKKMKLVDEGKHIILASSHPSPLGAYRQMGNYHSFNGSKIFSKINNKLKELGKDEINWKLD
jgi:uracil-DNA glycosylase